MTREQTSTWVRLTSTGAGGIGLAASARGLVLTTLPGRAETAGPAEVVPPPEVAAVLDAAEAALAAYYATWPESPREGLPALWAELLKLPLDLGGLTTFSRTVLERLRRIPPGEVATYGQLAARAGSPRAARAVGSVMAKNPLPIVLPCHRIIASDGTLGGFAGDTKEEGLALKAMLLRYEGWLP